MECMSRSRCNTSRILATTAIAARCLYPVSGYTWSSEENEPSGLPEGSSTPLWSDIRPLTFCVLYSSEKFGSDDWHPTRLSRDYRLLGKGGMGEIYRARD